MCQESNSMQVDLVLLSVFTSPSPPQWLPATPECCHGTEPRFWATLYQTVLRPLSACLLAQFAFPRRHCHLWCRGMLKNACEKWELPIRLLQKFLVKWGRYKRVQLYEACSPFCMLLCHILSSRNAGRKRHPEYCTDNALKQCKDKPLHAVRLCSSLSCSALNLPLVTLNAPNEKTSLAAISFATSGQLYQFRRVTFGPCHLSQLQMDTGTRTPSVNPRLSHGVQWT